MRHLVIVWVLLSLSAQADLSVKQIQMMVNKIHQKRDGISLETLETTKEPFVRLQVEDNISTFVIPTVQESNDVRLELHAILNGKAYINDSWIDENETILGYTLRAVGKIGVVLRNENHIKKLYLRKYREDSLIKFEESE
jgi:hypothetical protein